MSGHFGIRRLSSSSSSNSSSTARFSYENALKGKHTGALSSAVSNNPRQRDIAGDDLIVIHDSVDTSVSTEVSGSLRTILKKKSSTRLPYFSPTCEQLEVMRKVVPRRRPPPPPSHPPPRPVESTLVSRDVTPLRHDRSSSTSSSSSAPSPAFVAVAREQNSDVDQETTPTPVPQRTQVPSRDDSLTSTSSSTSSRTSSRSDTKSPTKSLSSHESWCVKLVERNTQANLTGPVSPSPTLSTPSSAIAISWDVPRSSDLDSLIPHDYIKAAHLERVPLHNIEPLFREEGLEVARCFAALRYRKDVIEEFRCRLLVSRDEPVYKMDNLTDKKSRLLLPDLQLGPTTSPAALDAFAHYVWPSGDRQLQDLKHVCGVMCTFRNLREPVYFATPDTDQQMFVDCFTVVRRVAIDRDARRRSAFGDRGRTWEKHKAPPSPSILAKGSSKDSAFLSEHHRMSSDFAQALDRCSRKLATSRAVQKIWVQEMEVYVIYWHEKRAGRGKYKHDNLLVYINPYKPELIVADKKGNALSDVLDLTTFCCSRSQLGDPDKLPSCIKRYSRAPHICFIECLNHDKRMHFSFLTSEDLKDFAQIVATLGHMQTSHLL